MFRVETSETRCVVGSVLGSEEVRRLPMDGLVGLDCSVWKSGNKSTFPRAVTSSYY